MRATTRRNAGRGQLTVKKHAAIFSQVIHNLVVKLSTILGRYSEQVFVSH